MPSPQLLSKPMLLQNSSVRQLIELQTSQGGQATQESGQVSKLKELQSGVSGAGFASEMQPGKKIAAMHAIIGNKSAFIFSGWAKAFLK